MDVIYTPDIFAVQRFGGISRYFVELISRLPGRQIRPLVAAGLHRNEYLREIDGVWGFYLAKAGRRRWLNELWCRSVCACNPRALVHDTYYRERPYGKRNRTVLTVYDMIDEMWGLRLPAPQRYREAAAVKRLACQRASHLIAISEATRQDLIRILEIKPEKITVVHLATSFLESDQPRLSRDSRPSLLYVGPRAGYKNFTVLLEAYAASTLLRESCDLVCFGGAAFDSGELSRLRELGLEGKVRRQTGDDATLKIAYAEATAYVCTSLIEGFGIPVLEAMTLGCPVICARTPALEEVAGDSAWFFDPGSSGEVRRLLEAALIQPDTLASLARKGCQRAKQFSWDKCLGETLAVYQMLD